MKIKTKVLPDKEAKMEADRVVQELKEQGAYIRSIQKKVDYKSLNRFYEIEYNLRLKS